MGAFANLVQAMMAMDVFRLFFPWLLVLAVVYGVLENSGVLSDDSSVNGVIALAVAFISIGGAYMFLPPGIMTSLAAGLTFAIFGLLGLMILLSVSGYDLSEGMEETQLPVLFAFIMAILIFIGAFAFQADIGSLLGNNVNAFQDAVMPILILVFLLAIVAITMGGGGDE